MSSLRIIVTGLIAQHPHMGGVAWDYVQYPVGLSLLGHDVYYFEDSGEWPYNLDGGETGDDWEAKTPKINLKHLSATMKRYNMEDRWAYRFPRDGSWHGLSDTKRAEILKTADLLINISGTLEHPENYRSVRRLIYIDSDPLYTQVKYLSRSSEMKSRIDCHDLHFSFGESFSDLMPKTGHTWRPTRQPVLLGEWDCKTPPGKTAYTTVMNWTSYPPVVHEGIAYGQKDIELRKFLKLPSAVAPTKLEISLASTEHVNWQALPEDENDQNGGTMKRSPRELLRQYGWEVSDPEKSCSDLDSYRDYITSSRGEWSVAKNGYVKSQSGWFSCRSACYLAAGRPVVVQDTGFSKVLPGGEGLFAFNTQEEAVDAIRQVEADYDRHARAARALAEEYFNSDRVLTDLIDQSSIRSD